MKKKKVPINLMVTEKMKEAIVVEATRRDMTVTGLIKQLLLPFVIDDAAKDTKAIQSTRKG